MRKHRLAERLLADVIGLDWSLVHDEACRWEHVMSEQVELRLLEMLGHPKESPYGNPIPGLAELGDEPAPAFMDGVINVVDRTAHSREEVPVVIRRLGEPIQVEPELLRQLQAAGILPGASATISANDHYVRLATDGPATAIELPHEVAVHIFVAV
jgi:DtxR family Mn-dependent transcriptional regulator